MKMKMIKINLELFEIYRFDKDCFGINIFTCGLLDRSLFGFNSDEDGYYLNLFWFIEIKINN